MTGWSPRGGLFAGTAALEHLLAHAGVEPGKARSEWPACEALLLGMGGLGFSVNLYPGPWGVHLALGFTRATGSGIFQRDICRRLGIPVEVEETGNAVLARRALAEQVRAGRPALLWGSKAALPQWGLRDELAPVTEHLWVVTGPGSDPETFRIADLARESLQLAADEVAAARSALFTAKHRRMTTVNPDEQGEGPGMRQQGLWPRIRESLEVTLRGLREPLLPSQGLPGLERWVQSLEDLEGPRGWAQQLADGPALFDAFTGLFHTVYLETGGALRGLWADFLELAADRTETRRPVLAEAAELYRALAQSWQELAVAALPDDVPHLAEARRLLVERDRIFRREGWDREGTSAKTLSELDRRFGELRGGDDKKLVPSGSRARELLASLAGHVRRIHKRETQAAQAVAEVVDTMGDRIEARGRERKA